MQQASYTLSLSSLPQAGTVWYVNVSAAPETGADGAIPILLSADGGVTWYTSLVLPFDGSAAPGSPADAPGR